MKNPFKKDKTQKISSKTKYDFFKKVKRDNFNLLNQTVCKENQTVFIGDSITEIYNMIDLFSEHIIKTGVEIYNRGINGDHSDRLLERLYENALSLSPRNLVILVGTNDLGVNAEPQFTIDNLEKILLMSKKECPEANIILQSIYPVNHHFSIPMVGIRKNRDINEINSKMKVFAEKNGITFIDFTNILSDEKGEFKKEYTYDGLHPNANGYCEITKHILPLLK